MVWRRMNHSFRLLCALAWLTISSAAWASEYHGQVTLGGLPVPGAIITATEGDKKSVAVTDTLGLYSFPDLVDGTWTIQVEMTGFAVIKQDVAITPNAPAGKWELKLLSLDQIRAAAKPVKVEAAARAPVVSASAAAPQGKNAPAKTAAKTKDSGAAQTAAAAPPPLEDTSHNDGLVINGSVNNAASSPFSQAPAFGNGRNNGRSLYNGGLTLFIDNSALDAKQFSVTGLNSPKASYNNLTASVTFQGPIKIPHLLLHGPNFAINYSWTRRNNDSNVSGLVPTADQRAGILPTGNVSPVSQAAYLLNFYPLPNVPGTPVQNFQTPEVTSVHQDALQTRADKPLGNKTQILGRFAFQSSRTNNPNPNLFSFIDATNSLGMSANVNLTRRIKQRLFLNAGYQFSRSSTRQTPYFENRENVSSLAGIPGNDQDATNWGPPSLNFASSGITGLNDTNSAFNRNETNALSYSMTWNRPRHNIGFGADFRRQESNNLSQSNPRGSFTFTGAATQGGAASTPGSVADFADFLVGIPDTSAIAFGNADKYFRQSVYDAYILDDWRVRPELTVNVGFRWEYGAPITELKNRLVNLDVASGFSNALPVLASAPKGPLTGKSYPTSLVHPDKLGLGPQLSISWRPISGSSVLIGAGYQITHDTSVYSGIAQSMSQQEPLSTSLNVSNNAACPLTLAAGFTNNCTATGGVASTDTFGIDPNFRVGYLQTWKLTLQRDLPGSLQMVATYSGNKGTRGTQQFLPNSSAPTSTGTPPSPCTGCPPSGFYYRTSNGNSTRELGSIQLRRRLRSGLQASATYTYSKSLDDDYALGGSSPSGQPAQNWLNLRGERGLSSFDQRNLLSSSIQYTTGMGIHGKTLMSGWRGAAYKEWTFLTTITVGSGLPETPIYAAALQGATCTSCLRPNVTGAPIHMTGGGKFLNAAAFSAPASDQFGDARKNSITGPGQFTLNASMQRTFRLHDHYNLNVRLDSTNALNHVVYTSWYNTINSSLFGSPVTAGGMRNVTATMSLRF
jgi:trimeric autotransporter adhesin